MPAITEKNKSGSCSDCSDSQVSEWKSQQDNVILHENAHAAAGGSFAGSPTYEYAAGPDGEYYIVAGEVDIDISFDPDSPEEMIDKMQVVIKSALAPADPSGQDMAVAGQAQSYLSTATDLLAEKQSKSALDDAPIFN